ncbi:MAG: hypothetical protein D5S00_06160 [Tindallia sp. MSAO_Bac2]|nr:MAG: hypothetical protein D5S00_06160 [Tindallia sp. MSAO_Bac2]
MEKLKDFIHDYSDLFLAAMITASMVFVVFWNLNTIFEEPSINSSAVQPPSDRAPLSSNDSSDEDEEDSDLVVIDLTSPEEPEAGSDEARQEPAPEAQTPENSGNSVRVEVPSGTPGVGIARILVDVGLIDEPGVFVQAAEELNLSLSLKSGSYDIPRDATPEQIVQIIAGQVQ